MSESEDSEPTVARRPTKSEAAFRTISEVSEDLDVPQHVLRFWESKFSQIKPLKRGGGRRYYRPEDVQLLRRIRDLLYKDGYTIRGAQKLLRESPRSVRASAEPMAELPIHDLGPEEAEEPAPGRPSPPPTVGDLLAAAGAGEESPPPAEAPDRTELESLLWELEELRLLLSRARKGGR